MICDCGVKPLPSTVNRTEFVSLEMVPGESEVIWATGSVVWQSFHSNIALQVQPDNSRGRAAIRGMLTEGKRLQGFTGEIRILPPDHGRLAVYTPNARCAMVFRALSKPGPSSPETGGIATFGCWPYEVYPVRDSLSVNYPDCRN
jgi:hypothetical protein